MDKAVYGVFLCLYIILPMSYACGTSDSPTTYILDTNLTISSPNYPDKYPNNAACHWLVQAAPGTKLIYYFDEPFEFEDGFGCQFGSVTLYDSSNATNIIGTYCGWSPPDPGTTTGRYLYVIFRSDGGKKFAGFSLEIIPKYDGCGTSDSPTTYVLEAGQNLHIMSPNYPEDYSESVCYWLVQAATDSKLRYRFIGQFEVGKTYGYLPQCRGHVTLYDSSNTTNVIGSYCGLTHPDPGVTTGRYLYVIFNPDGRAFAGFNLEITLKDKACSVPNSPITYKLGSGGTVIITSPNYPDKYPDNESLYWLVVTLPGSKLKYRFVGQFQIETEDQCRYDNVKLYDSTNTTNVIGSYCGSTPPNHGTTTGRYLYVSFKSDGRSSFRGFELEITSTDYECGTFDSPTTYVLDRDNTLLITSPNYPDEYPDNKSCYWLVQAAADCRIKYRFIDQFQVEAGDQCQYDNVTLYGSSTTTNVIGSYCGWSPPNSGFVIGTQLYVSFKSDGRAKYAGFILEITSKDNVCELSESPNTYILRRGQSIVITTTHDPILYPTSETSHWLVIAEQNSKLTYRFIGDFFDIEPGDQCQYDNVTLYDSSTTTNVIGSYCGNTRPNPGTTTGRFLYVIFKSDDDNTAHMGFKLEIFSKNYECGTSDSPITFALDPGHTLNITSPNYPANYPNDETCHWLVKAAPDNKLKYRFIDRFQLETEYKCLDEYVRLYDSSNTTNVIGSYCGIPRPNPGTTTGRYLYVSFMSNSEDRWAGFNLEITSNEDSVGG